MHIRLVVNGEEREWVCKPNETLLTVLRRNGLFGAKFGDESGRSGASTVLLDGHPVASRMLLAAQADGHEIITVESLGEYPDKGWKPTMDLHPLQKAFAANGAIQCGYCTPAMILAAKALLEQNPSPSEQEVRDALCGTLCRCTGYVKPVQAVLDAAAELRGETKVELNAPLPVPAGLFKPQDDLELPLPPLEPYAPSVSSSGDILTARRTTLDVRVAEFARPETTYVGRPELKVDAVKLAQGKPAFVADVEMRGMLVGKLLYRPMPMLDQAHRRQQGARPCLAFMPC